MSAGRGDVVDVSRLNWLRTAIVSPATMLGLWYPEEVLTLFLMPYGLLHRKTVLPDDW